MILSKRYHGLPPGYYTRYRTIIEHFYNFQHIIFSVLSDGSLFMLLFKRVTMRYRHFYKKR